VFDLTCYDRTTVLEPYQILATQSIRSTVNCVCVESGRPSLSIFDRWLVLFAKPRPTIIGKFCSLSGTN
jgi:hypothetical protein